MKRRKHTPDQIVRKLREADRLKGANNVVACLSCRFASQAFFRWLI